MNETRRLAYLRAMGIDSYVRRELLQSAMDEPAHQPARPVPSVVDTGPAVTQTPTGVAKALLGELQSGVEPRVVVVNNQGGRRAVDGPRERRVSAASEAPAAQLRFCLHFYRISKELVVISEIPVMANERIQQGMSRLLMAVLRTLGGGQGELARPDRFNWPLAPDDDASAERASEACQALEGFLRKRLAGGGGQMLLVFGDRCESLLADAGITERVAASGGHIIHTHGLAAMLQVPALKRSVWDAVRVVPELLKGFPK